MVGYKIALGYCLGKPILQTSALNMLCLSALCLSRDHFNHVCSIKGKIAYFLSKGKIDIIF